MEICWKLFQYIWNFGQILADFHLPRKETKLDSDVVLTFELSVELVVLSWNLSNVSAASW